MHASRGKFVQDRGWKLPERWRLSRGDQIRLLLVVAVAAVVVFGVIPPIWNAIFATKSVSPPPSVPGAFRPTPQQWSDLSFARVRVESFPGLVTTDATLAPDDDTTTPIYSPYSGRVTRLVARLGDRVAKGAPLMTVDSTEAVQARNDLVAAEDALSSSQAQQKVAADNEARQHELFLGQGAALKDWQQAQSDLATANGTLKTAEAALLAQKNRMRILDLNDSAITTLERNRDHTSISPQATVAAPISGTVIQRQVGLGQYIQSGASNPVYSIGDPSTLWVLGNVRESDAPLMRVGEPVDIRVIALPGTVFAAKLTWVGPTIDSSTHRLAVRAEISNPGGTLKPLMFATVAIHTGVDRSSSAVPASAVIYEDEHAHVWVANADKSLGLREVRVGRVAGNDVEVLSGLSNGDTVVTRGALFIDRAAQPD